MSDAREVVRVQFFAVDVEFIRQREHARHSVDCIRCVLLFLSALYEVVNLRRRDAQSTASFFECRA